MKGFVFWFRLYTMTSSQTYFGPDRSIYGSDYTEGVHFLLAR